MQIVSPTAAPAPVWQGTPATWLEPAPSKHIDRWNESPRRGANGLKEGELATVSAFAMEPLAWSIPAYKFTGGQATMYNGVELLVEDGSVAPAADTFRTISGLIDAAPAAAVALLAQVKVRARQDDAYDRYFEKAYGIPGFKAVAASGPGESTYFGGKVYAANVFFHELGHVSARLVNFGDWRSAIKADDAVLGALLTTGTLTPVQMGPVEPDPARRERWTARLAPGGITKYADDAMRNGGTLGEDEAEALSLRTRERYFSTVMATYTDRATGQSRPIGFAELYPNRAKLLTALGPAVADVRAGRTHLAA